MAGGNVKSLVVCVQIEHAVADGYDVRGLLYWTLIDNFEVSEHVLICFWSSLLPACISCAGISVICPKVFLMSGAVIADKSVSCAVGIWVGAALWSF